MKTMSGAAVRFQERKSIEQVEEGNDLAPKFDDRGLITVVTTDADSGELKRYWGAYGNEPDDTNPGPFRPGQEPAKHGF